MNGYKLFQAFRMPCFLGFVSVDLHRWKIKKIGRDRFEKSHDLAIEVIKLNPPV